MVPSITLIWSPGSIDLARELFPEISFRLWILEHIKESPSLETDSIGWVVPFTSVHEFCCRNLWDSRRSGTETVSNFAGRIFTMYGVDLQFAHLRQSRIYCYFQSLDVSTGCFGKVKIWLKLLYLLCVPLNRKPRLRWNLRPLAKLNKYYSFSFEGWNLMTWQ